MSGRILLAAGGTGGHMFPAQSLAEILKSEGWEIALMTDARGLKHAGKIPADQRIEVSAATISPRRPIAALKGMIKLRKGVNTAKAFIRDWQPDIVVGFGGYPAFPAVSAALSLDVPVILHEQNTVLGRVNRVFAKRANWMLSGFDDLHRLPKGSNWQAIGNPLRAAVQAASTRAYQPPGETINLLVLGGSLGARILGDTVPKALAGLPEDLRKRLRVVQQTRDESMQTAKETYEKAGINAELAPFFNDIETRLSEAHYVIARAGASSVSEIAAFGLPSLFVPLAIAMDDHQSYNAMTLKNLGGADILPESNFTKAELIPILTERLNDASWLKSASAAARSAAKPDAANTLADLVKKTAN